jgi:hypothetical protein
MLLKLKRTQKTMIGRLLMGETYRFDENNPKQKEVAASLLKRSMAEEVDAKQHAEDLAKVKSLVSPDQAGAEKAAAAEKPVADKPAVEKPVADKSGADEAAADKAAAK